MTELHIGLIGLGVVAVAGVVVYNTWQEYRHRKLASQLLDSGHADVLLNGAQDPQASKYADGATDSSATWNGQAEPERFDLPWASDESERIEPVLRSNVAATESATRSSSRRSDPLAPAPFIPLVDNPDLPEATVDVKKNSSDRVEPLQLLSPAIDYVASFEMVEAVAAYQIVEAQASALSHVRKPVHWIGYNERSQEWEPIVDDGVNEYRRVRVGLQTVDRQGAVSDSELSIFHVAMQELADELMAIAELPPRQPMLDAAVKLDEFCASVDIQIGINVISQGVVFPGTKLRALAESAGMVIDADGRFVRCDDNGRVLYVLLNQESAGFSVETMKTMSTHGLTFLLDVPRVAHGERVFNQMLELARRFSDVLRGALVDDNRQPLSEMALEPIRRQISHYQAMMAAQGLAAGEPFSQRLFS